MSSKGKGKAKEVFTGKRKSSGGGEERRRKRKNPGVLQFFEDAADVDESGSSDSEDIDNYFMEEEIDLNLNNEPGKTSAFPFVPKEEVIEEEFDRMMEERYKDGAGFVTYTEDSYEAKGSIDRNSDVPSSKDPTIWKVKCVVGRERHSAFCLMQKFIDMKSLGNKLQIISSFSVDNIKGFFYIEAERECDINEACKGLTYIYSSRVAPVPSNEVYHLLSVRPIRSEISVGMWARVKNGKYKGDLAQVVAVNNARKRATVKVIPRIDLQAMAAKFGGGVSIKRNVTVAPKLISSSELEEFRPLIQYRRDRESGIGFQVLDGMLLKDGYLYKKVSIDSLSCWSVMPTEEELLKFSHSENNETEEVEWLAQLYGEKKKKKTSKMDKGGEKGDGSSGFDLENSFELHDLVCFSRKDFGLIVGIEKDNRYKILKEASEGPAVVTVEQKELKSGPLDTKFTALDRHSKTISINDTVKVLEGQHEGKQGLVKQIYRGTVFLYDENETDNGGFFCCKSQMCEKIKQIFDACSGKDGGPSSSGFEVFDSSPKSPLSPEKPWEEKESRSDFKKGSGDGMFSIGQILRIRVGPLKGYLCRVLAVHYAECTVKVDSARKVLTVKNEHIAEVQGKSYATNKSENDGSSSLKPFDLGIGGSSGDWLDGAGTSAGGSGWNTESNSWPSFSGSGTSLQVEPNRSNTFGSGDSDMKKDGEDTAWDRKATSNQNSSWGTSFASENNDKETDGVSNAWENKGNANNNSSWGTSGDQAGNWNNNDKAAPKADSWAGASDAWGKAITSIEDPSGASKDAGGSWGQAKPNTGNPADSNPLENWGKRDASGSEDNSWGKAAGKWSNKDDAGGSNGNWGSSKLAAENAQGGWGSEGGCLAKAEVNADESSGWKKSNNDFGNQTKNWGSGKDTSECATGWTKGGSQNQSDGWNKSKSDDGRPSWGKHDGGSSWTKQLGGYSSGEQHLVDAENDSKGWKNPNDGWNKPSSGSGPGSGGWDQRNMENKDGKAQDSSWGKKSSFGAGTVDSGLDSGWGQKSNWNSGSGDAKQDSGWGKKSNLNSGSEDTNQDSGWGKKSNWNSGSGDTNQDSGWGKKSNQNSGSGDTNQDSGWGKKSNWNSGSGETNQDSGWGKKSNGNSGSGDTKQDSGWGKKSNQNSGSGDTNQDSGWGKKSNQNSGSGDTNQDSGWGKKSNWNSGSGDTNQDSGWGKKSNWNSGSGDTNQDSGWSKKSDWNSGSGNEDDNRGSGGSWRGGFGGRDGSGGGFRGRGNSDRGGFRGRGRSDRGGYGGRGRSDGGGFGGEGGRFGGRSEGGRFGGRSGEGGRFRGRGGERGGYGGRGRGRRDQNGDWNNGGDSGDNKPFSWKQDANNEGWKSSEVKWQGWSSTTGSGDGAKTWNQSDADQGGQSSGWNRANTDHGVQSSGWKQSNDDQGGKFSGWKQSNNDQGGQSSDWNQSKGGWNKGSGTTNETGGSQDNNWKPSSSAWNKSSSWDPSSGSKEVKESNNQGQGGWDNQGSGWSKGTDSGKQASTWNQSKAADEGPSSCRNESKDADGSGGGGNQDPWGKGSSTFWGQGSGSSKGGW